MTDLGTLVRVSLTERWKHEALDFTPWLYEHLGLLGEAVGLDLTAVEREADVGDFSVDILANEIASGRKVVIENQIRPTDHDHLGKLLTYSAWHEADIAIWVASEFREEHRLALQHLNQRTRNDTAFFGVEVSLLRIDGSKSAVDFRVVAVPMANQKPIVTGGSGNGQVSAQGLLYQKFFQALTDELREKYQFTNSKVAQPQNWCAFSAGITGCKYSAVINKGGQLQVELYVDGTSATWTKAMFDTLVADRQAVEREIGTVVDWQRLDHRRASRILISRPGIVNLEEDNSPLIAWAIEYLLKLKAAFAKRLQDARSVADRAME